MYLWKSGIIPPSLSQPLPLPNSQGRFIFIFIFIFSILPPRQSHGSPPRAGASPQHPHQPPLFSFSSKRALQEGSPRGLSKRALQEGSPRGLSKRALQEGSPRGQFTLVGEHANTATKPLNTFFPMCTPSEATGYLGYFKLLLFEAEAKIMKFIVPLIT